MKNSKIATALIASLIATAGSTAFACVNGEPGTKCGGKAPVAQANDITQDIKNEVMEAAMAETAKPVKEVKGKAIENTKHANVNAVTLMDDGLNADIKKAAENVKKDYTPQEGSGKKPSETKDADIKNNVENAKAEEAAKEADIKNEVEKAKNDAVKEEIKESIKEATGK